MPHSYDANVIQKLVEMSVMKIVEMDRDPDPPMLKHILIMNILKRAGVPNGLLYCSNHRDDYDLPSDVKYRKLNDGSAEVAGEPSDSLPKINVSGLINHIVEGLHQIP
uniref:Phosphonates import ATP-binding protein PhnC n=1 Tax=Lygus hesperus TaxID=30085 RepID=A0A0A9ZG94_LYGHE